MMTASSQIQVVLSELHGGRSKLCMWLRDRRLAIRYQIATVQDDCP